MSMAVFCIATNEFQAETIIIDLKGAGFADNDISVLFPDKTGTQDFGHEQHTKAPGNILISVHADDSQQAIRVKNIFSEAGAQDIAMTSEAEVPAKRFGERLQETRSLI